MTDRLQLISDISDEIISNLTDTLVYRLAIDGTDGAGKSIMGDELASDLQNKNVHVIRSSVDFFHNPREVRYKLGPKSPEGFFRDSFNYSKLKELLLDPIGKNSSQLFCNRYFNHRSNQVEQSSPKRVENRSVLVFDGIFLHREELVNYWDFSIFLNVTRQETIRRCYNRDGGSPDVDAPENRRYVEGQKIYLAQCKPMQLANLVVNNENFEAPFIEKRN